MIKIKKAHKIRDVKPDRVEHFVKNGWSVVEDKAKKDAEVKAVLRPTESVKLQPAEDSVKDEKVVAIDENKGE